MGSGIAQVLAVAGHEVVCQDIDDGVLATARESVATGRFGVQSAVERGKLSAENAEAALARLTFTSDLSNAVGEADVVVEAIPERLDLKIQFFRQLDELCPDRTILASNSSGFSIGAIGAATERPDRVIGWHWASPAPVMRLAEIVRSRATSDATVALIVRLARECGKNPVVVKDADHAWGYVANRIYAAMAREAARVADEGIASREEIDRLMIDCFRWPAGPFGMVGGATTGWK